MPSVRLLLLLGVCFSLAAVNAHGAIYRSENFTVHGRTSDIAQRTAEAAENCRRQLAEEWFGGELEPWSEPCRVRIEVRGSEPSGSTSYRFIGSRIEGLEIELSGSIEQILNSVLPHEMSHAVFATRLGHALPLWVDEGLATLSEDVQQQLRQTLQSSALVKSGRRLPIRRLVARRKFSRSEMFAVYVQGFSLVDFLVQREGKRHFAELLDEMHRLSWDEALAEAYGFRTLEALESDWLEWVAEGSPERTGEGKKRWVRRPVGAP